MEKEFIKYEEALALKELGFDEEVFGYYDEGGNLYTEMVEVLKAPLYQQAFRWFREKHDFYLVITLGDLGKYETGAPDFQCAFYSKNPVNIRPLGKYDTYEEAELECLRKLIQLIKEKK